MTGELYHCPQCRGAAVARAGDALLCPECRTRFPLIDGIPWLFAEPEARLADWRQRLRLLAREYESQIAALRTAAGAGARESTRQRLQRLADAYAGHLQSLGALLAPLAIADTTARRETLLALRTRVPLAQDLTSYYVNVHRDWVWGGEENAAALAIVRELAADRPLGNVLVLGSGAGRLAYDVHQQLGPLATVGLDINPLLQLVARRMVAGDALELWEFPIAPRAAADVAIARTLRAPGAARAGFSLVLADAMRAPFAAESFDALITPWFIDIVPQDLAEVGARVNALIRPGGRWLNFGSLAFAQADSAHCYTREEALEIVTSCGFAAPSVIERSLPYMRSPASRHARVETVFAFSAQKIAAVQDPGEAANLPQWLGDHSVPVPLLPHFQTQALANRIYAFVMALIDGRRSIGQIAQYLVDQRLMLPAEAEPAVQNFLVQLYEESRRRTQF